MLHRRIGVGTHQLLLKSSTTRNGHKNLDQEKTAQNKKEKCVVAHLRQKEKCVCLFWAPLECSGFFEHHHQLRTEPHCEKTAAGKEPFYHISSHNMCSEWCDLPDFEVHGGPQSVKICCEWPMGWVIIEVNYTVNVLTPRCLTKRPLVRFLEVNIKANYYHWVRAAREVEWW